MSPLQIFSIKSLFFEYFDLSNNVPDRTTVAKYGSITNALPNSSNKTGIPRFVLGQPALSIDQAIEMLTAIKNQFIPLNVTPELSPAHESGEIDIS